MSGLVTQAQLDTALLTAAVGTSGESLPATEIDDSLLASRLVEMGVLTPYQAQEIKNGRDKFTLKDYTITDWIGQGGMGRVYLGVHQVLGRKCAIKVLPFERATPEAINNFMREARTQAQLDHPNLVRVYDAGRDGSTHFLVVEYVPGTDLRKVIRSQGPLSQQQAASVILQAARGLDYAHKRGLIHRDVKPGNILVTPEGVAKVSDLGLAGFIHEGLSDPRAGKIVGTADYLSPEQISAPFDVTHTTDIYSLGCTLYYAVCGKVPFPGGTAKDKAYRHCNDTPWHPRRFNPDLDEEFVEVIADMMEKSPKSRIQSAAEVVSRLEQFADFQAPLGSTASARSPWNSGPLPSSPEEERIELGLENDGGELSASADASASQASQATLSAANQETSPLRPSKSRPLPIVLSADRPAEQLSPMAIVALTLVISIPVAMVAGALIATLALRLFGG
jgi:serine/threonine protein kinase